MGKKMTLWDVERFGSTLQPCVIRGRDEDPPLTYFFTSYFDYWFGWNGFNTNFFDEILEFFFKIETAEMLEAVAEGMDSFLAKNPTEQECDEWLNSHGGGMYDYTYHGFTTLRWIQYLRAKLDTPLREKVKERDKRLEVAKKFWENQKNFKTKKG